MKLKTYSAQTMAEAMDTIRIELGDDALIVSSQRDGIGGGVKITAAIEENDISEGEIERALFGGFTDKKASQIKEILEYHSVPAFLIERILLLVSKSTNISLAGMLSDALTSVLSFSNISNKDKAVMAIGRNGCGKTSVIVKLATKAKQSGLNPAIITLDNYRAGANSQLQAFAKILEAPLVLVKKAEDLKAKLRELEESYDAIYIDTPGLNPFQLEHTLLIKEYMKASKSLLPVLVMPAGLDVQECIETYSTFADIGVKRTIITKLDSSKRLGGIIAGCHHSDIALGGASLSMNVAVSLQNLNPDTLARILLPVEFAEKGA